MSKDADAELLNLINALSGKYEGDMADEHTGLGKLITSDKGRDAVHVAIAPVTATEKLFPGQMIRLEHANNTRAKAADPSAWTGIVDPFLTAPVFPEQRFWMWLRPGEITSLRHEWTHPAFEFAAREVKEDSEQWLRNFADANNMEYEVLLNAAVGDHHKNTDADKPDYVFTRNSGEYLHFNGRDAHGEIPVEFWNHVEAVTGQKIPAGQRATFFSCSC